MRSNVGSYSEQVFDSNNNPLNWMVPEPSTGGSKWDNPAADQPCQMWLRMSGQNTDE